MNAARSLAASLAKLLPTCRTAVDPSSAPRKGTAARRFDGLDRQMEPEEFLSPVERRLRGFEPQDVLEYARATPEQRPLLVARLTPEIREWIMRLEAREIVKLAGCRIEQVYDHLNGRRLVPFVRRCERDDEALRNARRAKLHRLERTVAEADLPSPLAGGAPATIKAPDGGAAERVERRMAARRADEPGLAPAYRPSARLQLRLGGGPRF